MKLLLLLITGRHLQLGRRCRWQFHRHFLLLLHLKNIILFVGLRILVDVDNVVGNIVDIEAGVAVPSENRRRVIGLLAVARLAQVIGVRRALARAAGVDAVDVAAVQIDFPLPFLCQLDLLLPLAGFEFLVLLESPPGFLQ